MKQTILNKLSDDYTLVKREMNELQNIHKGLYNFDCDAYDVLEVGNLFFIDMRSAFGIMTMSSCVITPYKKDLSFCNFDYINAISKETFMFEMYKTSLGEDDLGGFELIHEKYKDYKNYESSARWYDEYRLASCFAKTGKHLDEDKMLNDCLDLYLKKLKNAPECDEQQKALLVRLYVDKLLSQGGMAIDSMNKIIGKEKTEVLITKYMYNV